MVKHVVGRRISFSIHVVLEGVGASLLMLLMLGRVWWLPAHVPLDANEGWNAFHAVDVLRGNQLYPDPTAFTGNNYPPLSFYVVAIVSSITGDVIVAGRVVSLSAMIAIGGLIAMAVRRLTPDADWAAPLGAFLFLGFAATRFRRYVAMDDPQWLGQAVMMSAILLLLWPAESRRRLEVGRIVAAYGLMIAGCFIKHNLIAFPIAATLWLLMVERKSFILWAVLSADLGVVALGASLWVFGPNMISDIFGVFREYSYLRMLSKSLSVVPLMLPMAYISMELLRARLRDRRITLLILLVLVSLPIGIVQRSGEGVDVNAHFDALIALSLAAPVALVERLAKAGHAYVLTSLLLAPILVLSPFAAAASVRELRERDAAAATVAPLIKRIAVFPGRVACEDQALCYWGGKSLELDFFLMNQRFRAAKEVAPLRDAISRHWFSAAVVSKKAGQDRQSPIMAAFRVHYRLSDVSGRYWVLRPRRA